MENKQFFVDIPTGVEGEWTNLGSFETKEEAIKFIQENIDGNSLDGTISLISQA